MVQFSIISMGGDIRGGSTEEVAAAGNAPAILKKTNGCITEPVVE